jgi:hypothetical protein
MKEAFLLPLTSRPYDANKRVFMTNEINVIATRLIPIKIFKELHKDADEEAKSAFAMALAAEAHADADAHVARELHLKTVANTLLNTWNSLTTAEQQNKMPPDAFVPTAFAVRVPKADEVAVRTGTLRHSYLAGHLIHVFSTPATLSQVYSAPESDNTAMRLTMGHLAALQAAKPKITTALEKTAKIESYSAVVAVLVETVFDFWLKTIQKIDSDKLASAKITANQEIVGRTIKAMTALDQLTDHCEAFEKTHGRGTDGFADLLALSVLTALELALQEHVKAKVGQEKMTKWARLAQDAFVRKVAEQARLFLATQPARIAAAATAPALAALQVEIAVLRVENKRLADQQQRQQQARPPSAVQKQQQQARPPPAMQQQQQQQQQLPQRQLTAPSHPPGHPQYTGCAVRDASGRRCGAMDHGWKDHPT